LFRIFKVTQRRGREIRNSLYGGWKEEVSKNRKIKMTTVNDDVGTQSREKEKYALRREWDIFIAYYE